MNNEERSRLNEIIATTRYQKDVEARQQQQAERYRIGNPVGMTGRFEVWYPDGGVGNNGVKTFDGVAPPDRFVSATVNPAENAIGLHHKRAPIIQPRRTRITNRRKGVLTVIPEKYKGLTYWQYLNHADVKFFGYYNGTTVTQLFGSQNKTEIINLLKFVGMPEYLLSDTKKIDDPIPVDGWDVDYVDSAYNLPVSAGDYAVLHLPLSFFSDLTKVNTNNVLSIAENFVADGGLGVLWENPLYPSYETTLINALANIESGLDFSTVYYKSVLSTKYPQNTSYPVNIEPVLTTDDQVYADFYCIVQPPFTRTITYTSGALTIWYTMVFSIQSSFMGVSCIPSVNATKIREESKWFSALSGAFKRIDKTRYLGETRPSFPKAGFPGESGVNPYFYEPSGFTFDSRRDGQNVALWSQDGTVPPEVNLVVTTAPTPQNFADYEYFSVMHRMLDDALPMIQITGDWLRHCDIQGNFANYSLAQLFVEDYQWQ